MATREENKQNAENMIQQETAKLGNPISDTGWTKEGDDEVRTTVWNIKFLGRTVPIKHRFALVGNTLKIHKKQEVVNWKGVRDYQNWGNGARATVTVIALLVALGLGITGRNLGYLPWFPSLETTWSYVSYPVTYFWNNAEPTEVDVTVDATPKTDPPKVEVAVTPGTEPAKVKAEITTEPPTETKVEVTMKPARPVASIVKTVKADVRAKAQQALNEATQLYDAAEAEFNAATAKFNRLSAMKVELGKDWCNEAQLVEAKAKADEATKTMNGLTNHIYVLQDQLANGGTAVITVSMINGIDTTLQKRMAAFETRMEAKQNTLSTELKSEMKEVKETVNNMKTEVLEKIAALEKSIGANLTKILSTIASIPGQTAEDLKDLAKLIEDVKKEVAKHKDSPSKIAAIEVRLQDMAEKLSKPTPIPQAEVKPTPSKSTPVQKSMPIQAPAMIQGAYAPNCPQGWTCPNPQSQNPFGYVRQN